ncbi:MAG: hypothetical protein ACR2NX_01640 [Chthoniobacterales bacterium]
MLRHLLLPALLLCVRPILAADTPVQLLLPARTLAADSTFEVRFPTEMVRAEEIGKPAAMSPLLLAPAVPGVFVWLSTRSGSFAPTGTLPLGTKFTFSLRPGTKDAAGKAVAANLHETAETPPFHVKGTSPVGYVDKNNATVLPRYLVLFNANVKAADAAKYCRYVNATGERVDARVEQADDPKNGERRFPIWQSDDHSLGGWGEKAEPVVAPSDDDSDPADKPEDAKPAPARQNVLYLAPAKPLPPGADWRLVLDAGLPAADSKLALAARQEIAIGAVQPFHANTVGAENNRTDGRRVVIELNKSLPERMHGTELARWIQIEPKPAKLKTEIVGTTVTLKGDFAIATPYRVTIAAGLPASEPTVTTAPFSKQVHFEPVPPRLYFQAFTAPQFSGGTRQLRVVAQNVPHLHITATLFRGEGIPADQGFR